MRPFFLAVLAVAAGSHASVIHTTQTDLAAPELVLTWGPEDVNFESDIISPHIERSKYLCNIFIGQSELQVSVDARSHDPADVSSESVSRRVSEIYAQDDAHSGSPSFASELDPQPSISPSLSPSPVVQCTLLAGFDMFDDFGAPGTHPHSHHVSYPHPYVYTHSGPCPHSSLHKRIGFGFINILDLLSVLGVIAFAACASGIAALFRRRHRHGRYDYYDDDYEKKSPIESLDSDDEYHNHTHRHNRFNSLNHPHTHPASAYPYSGQGYHHLPSSGDAYQSEEVMRYIDSKLR
ncbi:hypothetical protein VKT23_003723 [Stygiomarasmius scandens]|uniref:Uncharacterized protein n=1 Tax=Marasmiellus scandens TaxID=2682957 RepID=A0ABR1K141_9AGAR